MHRYSTATGAAQGQFSLTWLLILVAVCAVTIRAGRLLGFANLVWIGVVALVVVLVCYAFAVAPAATRYLLTLGAVAVLVFSLVACGIQQARDQARRLKCSDNLRHIGMEFLEQQNSSPGPVGNRPAYSPGNPP